MISVSIYLQVHQPYRVKKYEKSQIGKDHNYFNSSDPNLDNGKIFNKVCRKSYLPTNRILTSLLKKNRDFKVSISFSGTVLEQMQKFSPETLKSFKELYKTGKVEILSETYYHSLSFFYSKKEFEKQVKMHKEKVKEIFKAEVKSFRNTELAYNNSLGKWADKNSYKAILTEGWEPYLKRKSPNFVYYPKSAKDTKLLLKNYKLSDDIAFRFSNRNWHDWPLDSNKFANWIEDQKGDTVNLFMDYETFGEHQWKETGIFDFLKSFPVELIKRGITFKTVSETADFLKAKGEINVPEVLTWADSERDLSAWTGNKNQKRAINSLYKLEKKILEKKNKKLLEDWRKLQTSDHFYYMCTKQFDDGGIHDYFSPYKNSEESHLYFMNVIKDLEVRLG